MENYSNFELLYDIFDDSIKKLYEIKKDDYLKLLCITANNLSKGEISISCTSEDETYLEELYSKISDIDLNVDDIKKAFMMHVLKAFKEQEIPFAYHTPDKIAQIMSFIGAKLVEDVDNPKVLDPLCGTGNLLFTFLNTLNEDEQEIFSCEIDQELVRVCEAMSNLLDYKVEIFNQDTLTTNFSNMDLIISDVTDEPSHVIYHLNSLKESGYMVLLMKNSLLSSPVFKEELFKQASLLGVVTFDQDLFKGESRSIVIIKKDTSNKNCLLMEIPSFENQMNVTKKIIELQDWLGRKR